ncbi:MAG: DUF423 domain-containing protein [Verrucomicrobiaceae bacterium]|nr:MAG: DUF423 domain-containing protein [Verrucomicrobiaceae bacterium]
MNSPSPSRFFTQGHAARVSAALAALGVMLGAFGAHALREVLEKSPRGPDNWRTAVLYHLLHAAVMLWIAGAKEQANRLAWWLMLGGILLFSGSLYPLSTVGWKWLGPVTPLGGLLLIGGWIALAVKPWAEPRE